MQAGLLREWIDILEEKTERDRFGAENSRWERVFRVRARVQFNRGDAVVENRELFHSVVKTVSFRYRPGVNVKMRLSWDGEQYRILSLDRNRADQSWVAKCELINE